MEKATLLKVRTAGRADVVELCCRQHMYISPHITKHKQHINNIMHCPDKKAHHN
jgi:hypothetical protein